MKSAAVETEACHLFIVRTLYLLFKAGAKLNAQNQIGLTPMMEAVAYNQREAVSLLVKQRDLDLYKRDFCTGDTALHIAVQKNYIHMVEILLQAGKCHEHLRFLPDVDQLLFFDSKISLPYLRQFLFI